MATLTLRALRKSFGRTEVIRGIDLDITDRELVVVVGPSGCGKSTLLRMIAGLEEITSGDLLIDGQRVNDVAPAARGLAMVFQSYALYPHMTVRQNMGFALRLAKVPVAERDRRVMEAARILRLEPYLDRRPKDLSGGQRQRVAIGRAIVREPKVFLFDEPLSNLDASLRGETRMELLKLHQTLRATTLYVTHDQVEAMTMADTIVVMQAGRVEQVGAPMALYRRPANVFVAKFIGSPRMNMLAATVLEAGAAGTTVALAGGVRLCVPFSTTSRADDKLTLGVRPENLRVDPAGPIAGMVVLVERLGGLTLLHVTTEGGEALTVQRDGQDSSRAHTPVRLSLDGDACHLFGADGLALRDLARHPLAA